MKWVKRTNDQIFLSSLPGTVTLFNLFTGFLAIAMTAQGKLVTAAWLIFLSLVWDSLDGNIARVFKNSTPLGRELDSIADVVSFITAPAFLVLTSWSYKISFWVLIPVFLFLGAGAFRLARFNLQPARKSHFHGLPTPASAMVLASTYLAYQKDVWFDLHAYRVVSVSLLILLGFLMISSVPYPKLSALEFSKWKGFFMTEAAVFAGVLYRFNFETALAALFLGFVVLSPASFLGHHLQLSKTHTSWISKHLP